MFERLIQKQVIKNQMKMVLLVMDGLGGLAREPGGKTELESAGYNSEFSSSGSKGVPIARGIRHEASIAL